MMELNVAGIVGESIVDGPGIRLTVFCQGCPHHCPGCQNPETWEFAERTRMSPEQILEMVKRNPLIRGVTLSGGEPFSQPEEHAQLAQLLHQNGYEVAAYTGYTFEQLLEGTPQQRHLLENIDVLVDGPFLLEKKTLELRFRGSSNQRVLNVPESLAQGKAVWESRESWVGERRSQSGFQSRFVPKAIKNVQQNFLLNIFLSVISLLFESCPRERSGTPR